MHPINNIPAVGQICASQQIGDKPLTKPTSLLVHIYVFLFRRIDMHWKILMMKHMRQIIYVVMCLTMNISSIYDLQNLSCDVNHMTNTDKFSMFLFIFS